MNIWQLRVLSTVIESGSLQSASEKLHRTPSALSMTLSKLEEELDFQILQRGGYRLALTERGEQFMRHSYELLRQHDRLHSLSQQLRAGAEPQLHVAFDYLCDPSILLGGLQQLQEDFPTTELTVSGHSQLGALQQVQGRQAELALTPWLPVFQQRADFESLFIEGFELVVVMASSMVPREGLPATREKLSDLPCILPRQMGMGINPEQIFRLSGHSRIKVNDVQSMLMFLRAGMGWGIIARQLIADDLASGRLVQLDIPGFMDRMTAEVHVVKLAGTVLGPAGEALWQYCARFDKACHEIDT